MSYTDERKGFSPASIGTVVAVHAAIGYAFISGLAYQVIHSGPVVTTAQLLPADAVPPPNLPPPPPRTQRTATPPPVAVDRIVEVQTGSITSPITTEIVPPVRPTFEPADTQPQVQPKPQPVLTRGAVPASSRADWVTTDDYPTSALREGVEGSVGIDVTIDANGRVSNCTVTASSGSDLLDQTTCKLYVRRARFTPALDEGGRPIAAHRADRVKWQIPR